MNLEEELEQLAIADARRVEDDLHGLGVAGVIAIGGVTDAAAGVTHPRRQDAVAAPDEILRAPEAAAGENRAFLVILHVLPPESVAGGCIAIAIVAQAPAGTKSLGCEMRLAHRLLDRRLKGLRARTAVQLSAQRGPDRVVEAWPTPND